MLETLWIWDVTLLRAVAVLCHLKPIRDVVCRWGFFFLVHL
jgi:hypothetical protein